MLAPEFIRPRIVGRSEPGRVREPRYVGVGIAVAIILVGIAGMAANVAKMPALQGGILGWPALAPVPAFTLALVGVALLAMLRAVHSVAKIFAALAAATALAGSVSSVGAFPLPGGGIPLSSAILLSIAAFAMLVITSSPSPRDEERALGIAGFVLVSLVAAHVLATVTGVLDPVVDSHAVGSSLQLLLCSLALGAYLLGLLWASGRVTLETADWLPIGVGFASMLTVLLLWRAFTLRELDQLHAQTRQAGEAQRRAFISNVQSMARSFTRAAEWHANGATPVQQGSDLQALQRDLTGLENVFFIAHDGARMNAAIPNAPLPELDSIWKIRVTNSGQRLPDTAAYWPLDRASQRFVVVAPSCARANASAGVSVECPGAIVGVVRTGQLFASTMSDTLSGFYHSIGESEGRAGPTPPHNADSVYSVGIPLDLGDIRMQLITWPTATTIQRVQSKLPGVLLIMGTVVSALLLLTTTLGQRAREMARTREKARLGSVLERATDGIWEWDLNTHSAENSPGIWKNLGYSMDATGHTREAWLSLIHPDDVDAFQRAMTRHLRGDTDTFELEYRVRSVNGDWHTMVDRARVVERTVTGQPTRVLGVRADVTEARNAHALRLLNERRFRAIFDSGFQFQLLLSPEGNVLEVNRVALEACNANVQDVVGRPVWEVLWWATSAEAREPLKQAFQAAQKGTVSNYETDVHRPDGPPSMLEVALKPFLDQLGNTNQILLEARDITARRRAEAALQEVDTLTTMGRVAARVAHEINNPLAGIQNSFLLIKGAVPTNHPHYAYVGAIEREIDRIAAVTRQLYETYRPEQDPGRGTSMRSLVTDAVAFLAQVNRSAQVRIETDFTSVPGILPLPSAMLRQIVYNLAQNAIEASPPGGVVRIQARYDGQALELSVHDDGGGVPQELRDRIFDPFFSTKDRGVRTGGMGLGLALVRRTVTAAGGTISVKNGQPGGAVFTVTIPVHAGIQGESA